MRVKEQGRDPQPSAGIVDSQSIKGADTVPAALRAYDAGKKINGRKRHIVLDTVGLLLVVMVTAASVQDRDGARPTLKRPHATIGSARHVWAAGGYSRRLLAVAKSAWQIVVAIVKQPAGQVGFPVLPRHWMVQRTFSWLMRQRRLVRDYERSPATHEAFVKWAMIAITLNRLAPPPDPRPWSNTPKSKFQNTFSETHH